LGTITNRDARKEDHEKSILLSLSNNIAKVRDKKDLLQALNTHLIALFPIVGFGITLLNEEGKSHSPFVVGSEDRIKDDDDFKKVVKLQYNTEDGVVNNILQATEPLLLNVQALEVKRAAYVDFWKKMNVEQVLGITLHVAAKPLGCLILLLSPDKTNTISVNLFKTVSSQISIAVSNIIANEDIVRREEEKTILLSLSKDIAALRNRDDLFQRVNPTIKEILSYKKLGIAHISEDRKHHSAFMMDLGDAVKYHLDFINITTQMFDVNDQVFSSIMNSVEPVILDVNALAQIPGIPAYVHFWKEVKFKYLLCVALRVGGNEIGVVFFDIDSDSIAHVKVNLLKSVCAQLSIAVSNILANEQIARREEEKTILLLLSNEIAALRNRNDLFYVVNTKLKQLFSVSEFGIAYIDSDNKTYRAFVLDLQEPIRNLPYYEKVTSDQYHVTDPLFSKVMNSAEPVLFHVPELAEEVDMPAYVHFWKEAGLQQVLCIALRVGGSNIGCAFIHMTETSLFKLNVSLLKGVCAQLSVAVSNILGNEEIARRESERELLLSLNMAISAVRNSDELLSVISQKLKHLIGFTHTVIATLNEDQSTLSAFLLDSKSRSKSHPDYAKSLKGKYVMNDGILDKVFSAPGPLVFDLHQLNEQGNLPVYFKMNFESGINFAVMAKFSIGTDIFGVWMLLFDSTKPPESRQVSLIDGLSYQIAIAIQNIRANKEIQHREEEKSLLLKFSNAIAAVKEKDVLAKVLKQQLNDLFSIEDYLINQLINDKKSFIPLLYDPDADFIKDPSFQVILNAPTDVHDGIFDKILNSDEPVTFNAEEWSSRTNPPVYEKTAKVIGLKKMTGVRICLGQEDIAVLNFRHDDFDLTPAQHQLLKSICSQIAFTISNLIAKNDIKAREQEKSRLLEFSNAIASVREKDVLAKIIKKQLKELFGIEDYAIHAISKDKKTHRPVLFDPDADFALHPDFKKLIGTETDVNDGVFNAILNSVEPVIFNVSDWLNSSSPPAYAKAAEDIQMTTMAGVCIRLGKEAIAVMNFKQDASNQFATKKPLFKSICSQLAIAISNVLANEKIENQLHQIEKYRQQLEEEKIYLQEEIQTSHNYSEIIGESPAIKKVFHWVRQVASSDSTVLLLGETGTGKELIARAIHNSSPRKNKLMIKINCAALPANLIESELFGHEKGSFTGAIERRIGKFELAHQGTLFLDEIGEMPLELQVKLLRALQEKEIERVGGKSTIKTDVRIIAATNRDLEKLVEEGKFRIDLYYRLDIFPIHLPPLRERREDIPLLASHFIFRFAKKSGRKIKNLNNQALKELMQYHWPGNIRELEHLIERSILLSPGETITEIHLPIQKQRTVANNPIPTEEIILKTIDENERDYILKVLKYCKGKISGEKGAAELLGIPPSTLNSRMKRLGIKREHIA
jgi:transcriptional regulator with GAF, ATPase, and Fis domain